ncbi:hypothetical protein B0H13DRAFT_1934293 [Mycena leptocephala]|nr:hypothetical protein B0H13DRAFT_1934293 [Mycena leptocephala]
MTKLPFIEWSCIWESIRAESGQTFSWPAENVSIETGQRKRAKSYLNSIGIQWWNYSWGVSPAVVQEFESDSGTGHVQRTRQHEDPGTLRVRSFQSLKERKFALPYAARWVYIPEWLQSVQTTQTKIVGLSDTHKRHRGCNRISSGRQRTHYYSLPKARCVHVSYRTRDMKGAIGEEFYFVLPTQAQVYGNVIEGHGMFEAKNREALSADTIFQAQNGPKSGIFLQTTLSRSFTGPFVG